MVAAGNKYNCHRKENLLPPLQIQFLANREDFCFLFIAVLDDFSNISNTIYGFYQIHRPPTTQPPITYQPTHWPTDHQPTDLLT